MVDAAYKLAEQFQGVPVLTTEAMAGRWHEHPVVVGITNVPLAVERLRALGVPRSM